MTQKTPSERERGVSASPPSFNLETQLGRLVIPILGIAMASQRKRKVVMMKIDKQALKEETRKLGLTLLGIGLAGLLIGNDKIVPFEALLLVLLGSALWFAGLLSRKRKAGKQPKE